MALINFFDTPLSSPKQKNITKEGNLAKLIDDYLVDKEALEEVEVYNAKTGKSYKKKIVPDSYKVCAVVNGTETALDYIPKSSDVIDIIISPRSNATSYDWLQAIGSAFMIIIGTALTVAGVSSEFGVPLIIGGVMGLCGAVVSMLTRQDENANKRDSDDIDKEAALVIKGAENELITGQRFPFVFGKIAINPRIYGSPYHETFVKPDGKFDSQYMNCLYCVGYGPLKLTDFKVGETVLMYNHPRDVEGEKENNTIIHGHIRPFELATTFEQTVANRNEYYTYNADKNSYDRADPQPTETTFPSNNWYKLTDVIPKKWKNNDVAIEILQRGLKNETDIATNEKWGTLYNKTVIEDQVDANILFIHDNDISVAAEKNYKGVAIPKGFRTNTVRLSQSCPSHLEVEVDFSNGLYRNRTEKHGDYSSMRYYDIPVRLAVQWRAVKKNNPVSDAENGTNGGWKTFDYLKLGDSVSTWQRPYPYSIKDSIYDMSLNAGASTENLEMFRAGQAAYARDHLYQGYYDDALVTTTADAQYARPYSPTGVPARNYYTETEKAALASSNAAGIASQKTNEWVDVNDFIKNSQAIEGGYITSGGYNDQWVGTQVFCINADKNFSTSHKPKDFNGNERLYVFTKDFTAAEVQEILASGSDWVEVRVIRLTPCYLDQSGVQSDNYGDFSYQDLCKWTYLRTTCFDKDAYTSAASTDSSADPKDYPLRPIRESDLGKFCFMAIRLKQDVAETGGSSLKKIRLTAESFSPKYNEEEKKWYPENLEASWGFYQKQRIDGEWKIVELTEQEYRDKVLAREPNLFKKKKGNNYTQLVANDIFVDDAKDDDTVIQNYKLLQTVEDRYIDTNTACSTMLAFVGPQNGEEAKGYDDINMTSATELFEFCKDVTDGTPLDFNYIIDSNFNTACNLTAQARVKTKAEMQEEGWDIGDEDTTAYFPCIYTYDASGEPSDTEYTFALVVTPILNEGEILSEADLIICANKIAKGETPLQNVLLARFDGPDCVQTADSYCDALCDMGKLYFDQSTYAQTEVLEQFLALKDIPFNRFIEDSPEEFLDAFETYFELPAGSYYYTTKVLEQMMLTQSTYKPFADNDDLRHIKFSCNGVISEEKKLEEIVKTFLTTARSMLRRDDENRYEFFIGKKVDYPVDVLNAKNVISKSNTRSFAEVPSGLQTNFPDEEDDYTQNPLYIMDKGEDWRNPSKPMEQFSIQFVTNRYQIRSLGLYNLAGRLFQRETYNRTVGRRGLAYTLGDVLLLQDESILVGTDNGGHIMELIKYNNVIYGFVSDEPFEYTGELVNGQSKQGVTVVQPDKYGAARCVTLRVATPEGNAYITPENWKVGLTNIIALAHPIICTEDGNYSDEPVTEDGETCALTLKEGDLLAFGEMTNITRKAQIVQIKPSQGKFNLTLVPYNDDFYNYGKELPRFNATLSVPQRDVQEVEFTEYATKADIAESKAVADGNKKDPNIDLTAYTTITTCRATRDGIVLTCDTRNIADGEKLTPISVTWTFIRENVWTRDPNSTEQYLLASPQPTLENFEEDEYYILDDGNYVRATEYMLGATYYVKNVMIEDVIINQITSNEETLSYLFDRGLSVEQLGGYPEYYDFYPIKVMASAKLTVSSKTADSLYSRIDITNYGTWVPRTPVIEQTVQDRHIVLTFSQPDGARVLYGQDSMIYRVQIKKVADNFSEDYAKPDLQSNPYAEFNQQQELVFSNESNYKYFYLANPQPTSTEQILAGEYYKKGSYDYERVSVYEGGVDYYLLDHGYIQSGRTFAQTLPLKGQGTKEMENTDYMYEVRAEAVNGMVTEPSHSMVTAMFTNFRDIVYAKAEQKELYVPNLSAISAELGEISGGSMAGNKNNYWTLTTKDNPQPDLIGEDNGNRDFQGAIRFGSDSQYIRGRPIVSFINGRYEIVDFELEFKIGSFDISSERTIMDSEIVIYNKELSEFDRCRISVFGTYYENRTNADVNDNDSDVPGGWKAVAYQESGGLMSKSVYSEDSLLLTNATIDERRTMGYDVGKPYLYLNNATITKVWHFDTNSYDQNGSYTLEYTTTRDNVPCINAYDKNGNLVYVLEYTSNRTRPRIIGRDSVPLELEGTRWIPDRNNAVMDFKPAILAVAPFSNLARSLFGVYKLTFDLDNDAALGAKVSTTGKFTVDFWIKFYYAEGQTLFDIGTANDRIQFVCTKGEVNYNAPQTYVLPTSQPESQQDIDEGEFYERHGTDFTRAYTYNSGTTYYIYAPEPPYNYDIKYSEGFVLADPQPTSQSDFGKGIPYFVVSGNDYVLSNTYVSGVDYYVQIVPYNHATSGTDDDMYIRHQGVSNFEVVTMRTLKRPDEIENNQRLIGEGMWTHFAVVFDNAQHRISCYINDRKIDFATYSNSNLGATAIINDNTEQIIVGTAVQSEDHTVILDELMIDTQVAEEFASFVVADPQPASQATIDAGVYYYLDNGVYVEARTYVAGTTYYVVDTYSGFNFVKSTANKIPWGNLNSENDYLVLVAKEDANGKPLLKTNIFNSDEFAGKVSDIIADTGITKEYIRNQNILSDWESFAITTTDQEVQYDGIVNVRYPTVSSGYDRFVFVNDFGYEVSGTGASQAYGISSLGDITVKKGDTIRASTTIKDASARWYKQRDYTGR